VTAALVIVISVSNGFNDLISSQINAFDPDLKIAPVTGKTFAADYVPLKQLEQTEGVQMVSRVLEENVLLKYGEKQYIATIKGVDDNYTRITGLDTMLVDGEFKLSENDNPFALVGQGIAYYLELGLTFVNPVVVYVLRKDATISVNPENAVNQKYIYPSGVFSVEPEHDAKYMIVPINFVSKLLEDSTSLSALEIKVKNTSDIAIVKEKLKKILGEKFTVKDRFEQKELLYRIMKSERMAIFIILSFILIIASFIIIGSLSVLIIEKKQDISTLHSMGSEKSMIQRIFQFEGMMIILIGGIAGLVLGLLICGLQIQFGLVKLRGFGSFVIDAYPVAIKMLDILYILLIVLAIGFIASNVTVRYIIKRYLPG
jgi:lipoprotein-releasing system permease protein